MRFRNRENCAYTPLKHPAALTHPTPVTLTSRRTHTLLNSGLVVFTPSAATFKGMLDLFYSSPDLIASFSFPDQDFLAHYFKGKWKPIGWQWNAIKTMRYWHPEIWRDEEVRNCHYICKKPWTDRGRMVEDQDDRVTHGWWWEGWDEWKGEREGERREEVVGLVGEWVAG